jgi:antitoxin component YwqK of YwqJK toxin-antitoxin module
LRIFGGALAGGLISVAVLAQSTSRPNDLTAGLQEHDVPLKPLGPVNRMKEFFRGNEMIVQRAYYDNGNVAREYLYKNGKPDGISRQYYLSGKEFSESPYRDGKLDGIVRFFKENGELLGESDLTGGTGTLRLFPLKSLAQPFNVEMPLKDGVEDGDEFSWYNLAGGPGSTCSVTQYAGGEREGWAVGFNSDGAVQDYTYYHQDMRHGVDCEFDSTGAPKPGYPEFHINDTEVSEAEYRQAAKSDPLLAKSLDQASYWVPKLAIEAERARIALLGGMPTTKP